MGVVLGWSQSPGGRIRGFPKRRGSLCGKSSRRRRTCRCGRDFLRRRDCRRYGNTFSVCDLATPDVNGDAQSGDGSCGVPFTGGRGSLSNAAGAAGAAGGTVHCCDGMLASSDGSGRSRACAGFILQFVPELSVLLPEGAGFFRKVTRCLLVLFGRYGLAIRHRSPDFMNV